MVPVKVDQLLIVQNVGFAVMLKSQEDERSMPIIIGAVEAQAIWFHINKVPFPRPLTHDLLKSAIEALGGALDRVEISDLQSGTFYANLIIRHEGHQITIDTRPSDAIALALRFSAPVFVATHVMDEAGHVYTPEEGDGKQGIDRDKIDHDRIKKLVREPSPMEILKAELKKAVEEERFEDAAKLRDQVEQITHIHRAHHAEHHGHEDTANPDADHDKPKPGP